MPCLDATRSLSLSRMRQLWIEPNASWPTHDAINAHRKGITNLHREAHVCYAGTLLAKALFMCCGVEIHISAPRLM